MQKKCTKLSNKIVQSYQKEYDLRPLMEHITGYRWLASLLSLADQSLSAQNRVSKDAIKNCLRRKAFKPEKDVIQSSDEELVVELSMSNPDDSPATLKFIRCISQLYPKVSFIFWKGTVSEAFLQNLSLVSCQMRALYFFDCQVASKLLKHLPNLPLNNLRTLSIISEKFNNRMLKKLMKIEMPLLQNLQLSNTQITTDSIRLLLRRPQRGYKRLQIGYSPSLNGDLLNREFSKMHDCQSQQNVLLAGPYEGQVTFVYLGYCAKYKVNPEKRKILTFKYKGYTRRDQFEWLSQSTKAIENIEKFMILNLV